MHSLSGGFQANAIMPAAINDMIIFPPQRKKGLEPLAGLPAFVLGRLCAEAVLQVGGGYGSANV